ncbi:MAG: arsenosugar biosynthesis radical SAM (seleno)protein ArsS [Thermodesulfobacteriota bacterium]
MLPFSRRLAETGRILCRDRLHTLQVNVGRRCNLACVHCHVDAGPRRRESMSGQTVAEVVAFAERIPFRVADITGGAPELLDHLPELIRGLAERTDRVLLRSNLVLLLDPRRRQLLELCRRRRVVIVASFPSINENQADAQRGGGVWRQSIAMLKELNRIGYGMENSGLELDLVSNPAGAFLPVEQCAAERRFKQELARRWDIRFNELYVFANAPLGRFRAWLAASGNFDAYMQRLAAGFNPDTLDGLMCRSLLSVSWQGLLYDCDFNLAANLPHGGSPVHVRDVDRIDSAIPIRTGDHCYACTAGAGFT